MDHAIRVIQRSNQGQRLTTHDFGASHAEFGEHAGDRAAVKEALALVDQLEASRVSHVRAIVFEVKGAEMVFRDHYPHDFSAIDVVRAWRGESFTND